MTVGYHLWLDNEAKGPFTLSQLRGMWTGGQLTGENLFSRDGCENWHHLADILPDLEPDNPEVETDYKNRLIPYLRKKWIIVSEGSSGAQLQGPKEMSTVTILCLILGVLLLVVYGSGLILIFAAFIGHAMKKPPIVFIPRGSISQLTNNQRSVPLSKGKTSSATVFFAIIFSILILAVIALFLISAKSSADKELEDTTTQLAQPNNNNSP